MTIQDNTVVKPTPNDILLAEKERKWRLKLPTDYKEFIANYNGGIPNERLFECNEHDYTITRFLCMLNNVQETSNGWYDISVVESQIGERLTGNEDLIGVDVLPIAALSTGDYVCLDYRACRERPLVCVWSYDESEEFTPITYKVADTFSEFVGMLR